MVFKIRKSIVAGLAGIALTASTNCYPIEVPCREKLSQIIRKKYIKGVYDCSEKTGEYIRYLWKIGYNCTNACAIVVRRIKDKKLHAMAMISKKGEDVYIDLVTGKISKSIGDKYKFKRIVREKEIREGKEWN